MAVALACLVAVVLDVVLGEPSRAHPLVAFGRMTERVERMLHPGPGASDGRQILRGLLGVALLVVPPVLIAAALTSIPVLGWVVSVLLLYLALGGASLARHARPVGKALATGDIQAARLGVARLVSRDTEALDSRQVSAAAVESVLENGSDAVFAALFWFLVAGAPGVVLYRLVNTLDAMWGYRTERYLRFGRAAARLDDVLNWVPARLTALSYALAGKFTVARRCARRQGGTWESANAGTVMAAGAGALGVELGGGAPYHGQWRERPVLGEGRAPEPGDIDAALALVHRTLALWLVAILVSAAAMEWL